MSTKIYHGYRLAEGTDIWDFTERLREVGNVERDRLDLELFESIAAKTAEKRADEGLKPYETRRQALMAAMFDWTKTCGEDRTGVLAGMYDLNLTFIRDTETGRILVLSYCHGGMEKVFTDMPEVEYYGYWDNTDPDEDCSEEEWLEREETWERALGMDAPVQRGIGFELRGKEGADGAIEMIYRETGIEL